MRKPAAKRLTRETSVSCRDQDVSKNGHVRHRLEGHSRTTGRDHFNVAAILWQNMSAIKDLSGVRFPGEVEVAHGLAGFAQHLHHLEGARGEEVQVVRPEDVMDEGWRAFVTSGQHKAPATS